MIRVPCATPRCPHPATYRGRCADCTRRLDLQRGTREERGYGASWRRLRLRILERDPTCRICLAAPSTTVDHIISKRNGGTDDDHNLRGVCASCNARKSVEVEGALGLRKLKRGCQPREPIGSRKESVAQFALNFRRPLVKPVVMERRCECGAAFEVEVPPETLARLQPGPYRLLTRCSCGSQSWEAFEVPEEESA
jgi:5-methylcytosine-specific restriction protein A